MKSRCYQIIFAIMLAAVTAGALPAYAEASQKIRLWKGSGEMASYVTLRCFLPQNGNPIAGVIICPGGSYYWHDSHAENVIAAKWLASKGIAAFVLRYRTAGVPAYMTGYRRIFRGTIFPDCIKDLQRAILYLREYSERYCIPQGRIGVMGFSAGGHLAVTACIYHDTDYACGTVADSAIARMLRPDFAAAIYPVITLTGPYAHLRSVKGLLGERLMDDARLRDSLSLHRHIPLDCPPIFITNCLDDTVVDYRNSCLLDSALTAKDIPHCHYLYSNGNHGYGADSRKAPQQTMQWKEHFLEWMKNLF